MHRHKSRWILALGLGLGLIGCQTGPPDSRRSFVPEKLAEIDTVVTRAIADKKTPGAVLWLERNGSRYVRAYGNRALEPSIEPATEDTLYDAASLTKVLATTPAVMLLIERGQVQLDTPVHQYLPEFTGDGRDSITVRQLLTHCSGLRPDVDLTSAWSGYRTGIQLACAEKPQNPPGTVFRYSDINFILLGEVVRRVSGCPLDEFVERLIYQPLKMHDTGFLPPAKQILRIAPTEQTTAGMLRGVVHDPTARRMGGVAGHAGLFTTAADMARFARMMLGGGALEGVRIFQPETVQLMTSVQSPRGLDAGRGLGWDVDSGYSRPRGKLFPLGSYGHTGWTGTLIWIDPHSKTFWIFLSNRVHPAGKGDVLALYGVLGTLCAEAIRGFDFSPYHSTNVLAQAKPANEVRNGIDVLVKQNFAPLKGLRLGLITNQTGKDRRQNPTIDLLRKAVGTNLVVLFSPEHGIRGDRDERITDSRDPVAGLPIYSLYGKSVRPQPDQLKNLDALVFDIQDIGCRFYTYITTMGYALEAASQAGIKFFVLDRVNPITGVTVAGPVLTGKTSFTAYHPIPVRFGMTLGELAGMFNAEKGLHANLTVIPIEGWSRAKWFDQTGLPWVNPSPNMRSLTEAALYPGVGLLETTALSVGRGTDTPFEVVGAPYIDEVRFATELNRAGLVGVRFVPVRFTPAASVFKGQPCGGVNIVLSDRDRCPAVDIGMVMAKTLFRLYPREFNLDKFNALLGHQATIDAIRAGRSLAEIHQTWEADLEKFQQRRARFLLY